VACSAARDVTPSREDLRRQAQRVLDRNRRGAWTCPSEHLYPHQWLWDSCFVAIGLARTDPARAAEELRSVFRGQWANGMLPHMIFSNEVRDPGSRRVWQSRKHPGAPRDVDTSCITQPPLPAIAAWHVLRALPDGDRRALLDELVPKLVAYHEWLYRDRDPSGGGLVTLIHPWECGLDTTPPWMDELARVPGPWWMGPVLRLRLTRFVHFVRRDTRYVPDCQRPSDDEGLRMLVLARRAKRFGFELRRLPPGRSLLIEDLAFNALLVAANRALGELAETAGVTLDPVLRSRMDGSVAAIDRLWDESTGQYCSRHVGRRELIRSPTVATFLPLVAAPLDDSRRRRLLELLADPVGFGTAFPVPSVPRDAPTFEAERYWKGPTWINMNWLIVGALERMGEHTLAATLRDRTLELVERSGCAEYFSALTGVGLGAPEFSWTAALTLDLLAGSTATR
jgi:Glycosyl hydrolase family 63 C-terminal domain